MDTNFLKMAALSSIMCLVLFFVSCQTEKKDERKVLEKEISLINEQADKAQQSPDSSYIEKRSRIFSDIDEQIAKSRNEKDSLITSIESVPVEERGALMEQVEFLEGRIAKLQQKHEQLAQGGSAAIEIVEMELESILHEGLEVQESDREVRGEGTALSGPDLNTPGTRTGTEIEKRQKTIEEDMDYYEDDELIILEDDIEFDVFESDDTP